MANPIVAVIIVGAGIAVAAWSARGEARRRTAMLRDIASRRGGSVDGPRLVGMIDGLRVEVKLWSTKHARFTEYWVHAAEPGTASFKIAAQGFTSWVGKQLGAQDVELGYAPFDAKFTVKARDSELVRRVWTREQARKLLEEYPSSQIDCDSTRIHLLEPTIEGIAQIERGLDFVLSLAKTDAYGIAALQALPEAVMRPVDGFPHAHVPGPQPILVGPRVHDGIVRTCARTTATTAELPMAVKPLLAAIGDGKVEMTDIETRVCWPTIETDTRRLMSAVELLRTVAMGPSLGVFR